MRKNEILSVNPCVAYQADDNPYVTVFYDQLSLRSGVYLRYNRIVEGSGRAGVVVLPLCGGQIGLVRQYRYPVGVELWECPRGFGQSASSVDDAARELCEETGIKVARMDLVDLGCAHPNSGMLATTVRCYVASLTLSAPSAPEDEDEISKFRWFDVTEIATLVRQDNLRDGFTLSVLMKATVAGLLPSLHDSALADREPPPGISQSSSSPHACGFGESCYFSRPGGD